MRIAILNWRDIDHPEAGGSERLVHEQANALSGRGHRVTLFTASHSAPPRAGERWEYRTIRLGGKYTVYPRVARWFARNQSTFGFDVLLDHVNGIPWFAPYWSRIPCAAYLYHPVRRTFLEELPFPVSLLGYGTEAAFPSLYSKIECACLTESIRGEFQAMGFSADRVRVI